MATKRAWDLTSVHSLESAAEWLREKSGALAVVVVRPFDAVLAADARVAPSDARELVVGCIDAVAADLNDARTGKRKAARLELGEMHE